MEAFICEIVEPRVLDLIMLVLPKWRLLLYIFLMNVGPKPALLLSCTSLSFSAIHLPALETVD